MTVLFVHNGEAWGGASRCLRDLIAAASPRYKTTLLTSGAGLKEEYERAGAEVMTTRWLVSIRAGANWYRISHIHRWVPALLRTIPSIVAGYRAVKLLKPGVVHLNSSSLIPFAAGARLAGGRIVWHVREPLARGYFGFRRALIQRLMHACACRIVAICDYDKNLAGTVNRDRCVVALDWLTKADLAPPEAPAAVRSRLGISPAAPVVAYLGGGSRIKGIEVLLKAIPQVLEACPGARFVLAGCAPQSTAGARGTLKKWFPGLSSSINVAEAVARDPRLTSAVVILPVLQDTTSLLNASDILVFPSTTTHFGRPIVEAAALGKPSVASDFGEIREALEDGVTGCIVPPSDVGGLARALSGLLSDAGMRRRMGTAARVSVLSRFGQEKNLAVITKCYDDIFGATDVEDRR